MIHRFVLPRYSVYPSHEHKAFIPYSQLLHNNNNTFDANAHQHPSHCESRVIQAKAVRITNDYIILNKSVKGFGNHVPYTYLVYALGAKLPGFLSSAADSNKLASTNWIKSLQERISTAQNIVVVGGGALGIQYASDIKEFFPDKTVRLIHSRDRFLPLYDSKVHDLIYDRLCALGVEVYFNNRVTSPLSNSESQHIVSTSTGLQFPCDLQLNCTGLQYNSSLLASLSPSTLNTKTNCIKVLPTLQLADPKYPNIYVIGDVADTPALKNAVSGWFQAEVVARNIVSNVRGSSIHELETYTPGPPVIKVTVGKNTYLFQRPNADTGEPEVGFHDAKEDLDAAVTWKIYGADVDDLFA
jgi:NADH dehydrogenase FAD-containing subunit